MSKRPNEDGIENQLPSTATTSTQQANKKQKKSNNNSNDFPEFFVESGFKLLNSNENDASIVCDDFVKSKRMLVEKFKRVGDLEREQMQSKLKNWFSSRTKLRKMIQPIITSNQDQGKGYMTHDSLARILLSIVSIQQSIISFLLEALIREQESPENFKENIPRMIIGQLKWMETIVSNDDLLNSLKEAFSIITVDDLRKELIASMTDIFEDSAHIEIAMFLAPLLTANPELCAAVLEALGNLVLPPKDLETVRENVANLLEATEPPFIPAVVRYLVQSLTVTPSHFGGGFANNNNTTKDDNEIIDVDQPTTKADSGAKQVIQYLRSGLKLEGLLHDHLVDVQAKEASATQKSVAAKPTNVNRERRDLPKLIFDSLRTGFRFNKDLVNASVREIQATESAELHSGIDLWLLFVVASLGTSQKRTVETVFRKKILAGHFSEDLLNYCFHGGALVEIFPLLVSLTESFLRSPEVGIRSFATSMYVRLFEAFSENTFHKESLTANNRQEIIGSILTHFGSGVSDEIDAALEALLMLTEKHLISLLKYDVMLRSVSDYVSDLEDTQLRRLYKVFASITYLAPELMQRYKNELASDQTTVHLSKQLALTPIKNKRIGAVGVAAMIAKLTQFKSAEYEDEIRKWLSSAFQHLSRSPICLSFFYDELGAVALKTFSMEIMHTIIQQTRSWHETFAQNLFDPQPGWENLVLDEQFQSPVGVKFLNSLKPEGDKDSWLLIPAQFSLLFRSLAAAEGFDVAWEDEKDYLNAYVELYETSESAEGLAAKSPEELNACCYSLFAVIDWFREVINLSNSQSPDAPNKVHDVLRSTNRLEDIIDLEKILDKCLSHTPAFTVPSINGTIKPKFPEAKNKKATSGGAKEPKPKKKKKGDEDLPQDDEPTSEHDQTSKALKGTYVAAIRPYFRDFRLETYRLFYAKLSEEDPDIIELQPHILQYLLQDLLSKLNVVLTTRKRTIYFALKQHTPRCLEYTDNWTTLSQIQRIWPALMKHLERIYEKLNSNTDLADAGENWNCIKPCYLLLLEIFTKFFGFSEFYEEQKSQYLHETLLEIHKDRSILDENGAAVNIQDISFPDLIQLTYDVFSTFSGFPRAELGDFISLYSVLNALAINQPDEEKRKLLQSKLSESSLQALKMGTNESTKYKADHVSTLLTWMLKYHPKPLKLLAGQTVDMFVSYVTEKTEQEKNDNNNQDNEPIEIDDNEDEEEGENNGKPQQSKNKKKKTKPTSNHGNDSETFATLQDYTITVYFKVLLTELVSTFSTMLTERAAAAADKNSDFEMKRFVHQIESLCTIFIGLLKVVSMKDLKPLIVNALKQGRIFVDRMVKVHDIITKYTIDNKEWFQHMKSVVMAFQGARRSLYNLCSHVKTLNDSKIATEVPAVRKSLESMVHKIREAFFAKGQTSGVKIGKIKPTKFDGEKVSSQREDIIEQTDESQDFDQEEMMNMLRDEEEEVETKKKSKKATSVSKEGNNGKPNGKKTSKQAKNVNYDDEVGDDRETFISTKKKSKNAKQQQDVEMEERIEEEEEEIQLQRKKSSSKQTSKQQTSAPKKKNKVIAKKVNDFLDDEALEPISDNEEENQQQQQQENEEEEEVIEDIIEEVIDDEENEQQQQQQQEEQEQEEGHESEEMREEENEE